MAASETQNAGTNLTEILKPFHQRASEAEDRLVRLEAAVASNKDAGNEELLKKISELQSKVEDANAELVAEREKAAKLSAENAKLQYRITHLVRAVRDSDAKLESMTGGSDASAQTALKLNNLRL